MIKTNELGKLVVDFLDVLNLDGFIKFNFGSTPNCVTPKTLTPANVDFKTEIRLRRIQSKLGWNNSVTIEKLNLPQADKLQYEPMVYKYVYAYYIKFKTDTFDPKNHVSDDEITKPVDNVQLFAKLLL